MKILLLTDDMLPGGVERHVVHLANGLYERGINVSVAATEGSFRASLNPSIRFIPLPLLRKGSFRKRIMGIPRSLLILHTFIKSNDISIIHSHKRYTDLIAKLILLFKKDIKHVSTCHSTFTNMRWLSFFGQYTIACSKTVEKMLIKSFGLLPRSLCTIHNGVPGLQVYEGDRKNELKVEMGIPVECKVLCSVGSLTRQKNPEILLHAFTELLSEKDVANMHLIFVGEGELRINIEKYIDENNLQSKISILPSNTAVENIFNISDFCVLTSDREGFPLVLLEAASIGKPYIATNVGGIAEFIVDRKEGILIEPNDIYALKKAISYLVNNADAAVSMGRNAQRKCLEHFNLENMLTRTIEVYKNISGIKVGTIE
jgi:glycosyltransferase involved in cell wall biosynthesis